MEEKEMTPQEWEISVKEKMAKDSNEVELLDLAQDIAIHLAAHLGESKALARNAEDVYSDEIEDMLRVQIGRMAVMLDVLQLKYCDCADEEMCFLEDIAECMEA